MDSNTFTTKFKELLGTYFKSNNDILFSYIRSASERKDDNTMDTTATKNDENVKMISPWVNYYKAIKALFMEDPDVNVKYDEDDNIIKVYVERIDKWEALDELLPREKTFGNVSVTIQVIPANVLGKSKVDLFAKAFEGNKAVADIATVNRFGNDLNFIIFKNKVVQYPNDDIGDFYGLRSTIFEDLAREVFGGTDTQNVFFSTEPGENISFNEEK